MNEDFALAAWHVLRAATLFEELAGKDQGNYATRFATVAELLHEPRNRCAARAREPSRSIYNRNCEVALDRFAIAAWCLRECQLMMKKLTDEGRDADAKEICALLEAPCKIVAAIHRELDALVEGGPALDT